MAEFSNAERHNALVSGIVKQAGRQILLIDGLSHQMVAIESVTAGLLSAALRLAAENSGKAWSQAEVETWTRQLFDGVSDRMPKLMEERR